MANVSISGRGINNTPFSPNADLTAQLTGSGLPVPGNVAPTYATNTDITSILQFSRFVNITTTNAVGNSTILCSAVANPGAILNVQIVNDAIGARTITFGAGFRATGTVVGTNSKVFVVQFISDGLTFNEVARSASAIT